MQFLEDAYKDFGELTGRYYGLISQYKTDDADTVFVSLGSAAENIEAAVDYLRETRGVKVGSIHVNVIRPFPEAAIVAALKGKKNVIILERTDEALGGDNPLGRDIRTALSKAVQYEGHPGHRRPAGDLARASCRRSTRRRYGLGSRDFRPEHIIGAYEFATAGRARKDGKSAADGVSFFVLGIDHPYAVIGDETPSLLPEGAVAVRFHSIGGWGAITTGKNLGAIIGDLNDLLYERDGLVDEFGNPKEVIHVSANPKYGSEKKGAPTSYFMVAAKDRIRVNCDLRHVTVVLCCDPKAFTHTNPLDGMQPGGRLVWESDEEGERAWERLPLWARKQIIDKNIRVFTLPGFEIARKGDRPRRSATAHAGQRLPRRILRRQPCSRNSASRRSSIATSSQAVRQEVRQARRSRRQLQHGSHDPGLRASAGNQDRRAHRRRRSSLRGEALLPILEMATVTGDSCTTGGCRSTPPPAGQGARTPISQHQRIRRRVPLHFGYDQPATPLSAMGVIAAATGDTASKYVARRETPLYIPENCTQCMECISVCPDTALPNTSQDLSTVLTTAVSLLRRRPRRAHQADGEACRKSRSRRASAWSPR